jgi:hypothetical protein
VSPDAAEAPNTDAADAAEQAWRRVLARLEAEVRRARGGEQLEGWLPPAGMPPLPASLLSRALALLEAQAALQASVAAQRNDLTRALARRQRAGFAAPAHPVYLDAVS